MATSRAVRSISYLKSRAAGLLEQINRERQPVIITQKGEPRAVLIDPESYDRLRDAVGLLKLLAQGEEDVRAGRTVSQEALFARLDRRYAERHSGEHRKRA